MADQTFFHLTFAALFVAFIAIRLAYHRKVRRAMGKVQYKEGIGNAVLRAVLGITGMLILAVYAYRPDLWYWARFPLPVWAQWVGVALGTAAISLVWWVHSALGDNFSTTLHVREQHTLVTNGPYRWVRHPMYSAFYVLMVAILLLTANWFIGGALLAGLTVVMAKRVMQEETVMVEKFGQQYRAYMTRTGRFVPRLAGLHQ